jgi:dehydrogenase/reductase SDR family protein 7B
LGALQDKVVIITGASSGIGEACAKAFAREGCRLVLAARNIDKMQAVAESCRSAGVSVLSVKADVSREEDCRLLVEKAVAEFGSIDVLVCNAGISMRALFENCDLNVLRQLMDTNFWGTVYCVKYALPFLLKSKGSVVGVSSIAGYKGLPGRTGYSASKFAMHGFLESLRSENQKKGLHVLIACPGFTASNIRNTALDHSGSAQGETPLNETKLMQPETVAGHIVQSVKGRRHRLTLTMQGRMLVLLNKFFPAMADRLVYKSLSREPGSPFK